MLRLPVERIERNASIYDLGMDSLMAVELHMAVEERFNVHVPVMTVTGSASITQLAGSIAGSARQPWRHRGGRAGRAERGGAARRPARRIAQRR